ncbi:MAG: hypothetical protein IM606_09950 [Cytophagales bacterium]|jgi:hypothetical protein|nr:hypothetical protein [Cytophagales bacterium]
MAKLRITSVVDRFFDDLSPLADADTRCSPVMCDWSYIWGAVIMQAFADIKTICKDAPNIKRRQEAIAWLDTPDFNMVCDYANINPVIVKEFALRLADASAKGVRLPSLETKGLDKAQSGVRLRIHTS